MSGKYLLLYKYLNERYANTVVLTFAEIEDLLGFALPDQARLHQEWWTDAAVNPAGRDHSDSWTLASRTATPNMSARSVAHLIGPLKRSRRDDVTELSWRWIALMLTVPPLAGWLIARRSGGRAR